MKTAILLVLSIMLMTTGVFGAGGDMGASTEPLTNGSSDYPYLIEDLTDFDVFANPANSATYWASGVHTKLMVDIDLNPALAGRQIYTTAVIAPDTNITTYDFDGIPFAGDFDGNSHRILNLTIDTGGLDKSQLGLFGQNSAGAVVANLGLEGISVTGSGNFVYGDFTGDIGALVGNNSGSIQNCWTNGTVTVGDYSEDVGGLCGWNQSTGTIASCYVVGPVTGGSNSGGLGGVCGSNDGIITNCWASSAITGKNSLGSLCGENSSTISNCYATGSVTGGDGHPEFLGGLCGYNSGTISNCNATGLVTGGYYSENLGGLCGHNTDGSISNCYATGSVTGGDHSDYLGGLCGENENGTITNCYATDSVTGGDDSWSLGGLCGGNTGTVINCYSAGSVTGGYDSWFLGGLCGVNISYGTISNCYSTGDVEGGPNSWFLGGLCGSNGEIGPGLNSEGGIISKCYATGSVTGGSGSYDLGGLCGNQYGDSAEISNCFWDTETSGMTTSDGGTGKTTAEMKQKSTFTDAGWDFAEIWGIDEGVDYPRLWWESITDPIELLDMLAEDVIDFVQHEGIENSLLAKLDVAFQKLEDTNDNNDMTATKPLQAFINAVQAQSGKKISEEDANGLISAAQEIIELLSEE